MRRLLDGIYRGAGWAAGVFMVGTLAMVLAGVLGRVMDFHLRGTDSYAGFCMAASFFLALAHTFVKGEHIRVSLVLQQLRPKTLRVVEIACHLLGATLAWVLTWFSARLVWQSHVLNDVSQGMDATPLWVPQIAMAVGAAVLAIAVTDRLWGVLSKPDWQPPHSETAFSE
ncbi:TRAP transporter small permease [Castellaniella sp. GW247-6E4]|uniref:TRAP transporter small permease n=1 Tax=Castellaniella sp. GW247-6E4 TaxID=3140380 RepID=UPI0033160804